ncbi:MAG TPA: hypothetical protein VFG68_03375 [Fimbriiglobus sp.]|nr:hypothetical protein [Fimbriiglobus sp.]
MKITLNLFALLFFGFTTALAVGCGGKGGPVTPATTDEVPTSAEPPPGQPEPTVEDDR